MSKSFNFKFGRKAISVEEARKELEPFIKQTDIEHIPLALSFGRTIAKDILAAHPVPHFRRSGVDGYAVRSADIAAASPENPVGLTVIEHIPSGTVPIRKIESGMAARIMTGAPVPEGADAVVMLEMTEKGSAEGLDYGHVERTFIRKSLFSGQNITPIAGEISEGERVLQRGCRIASGEAALLATFGYETVAIYSKPRVAIFSTGSELLKVGDAMAPGRIRNSNSYMLACQVEACGGIPMIMPPLADDPEQVQTALVQAFESADCVITSGGVSVGDYDVLVEVFKRWNGTLLFNKIAMRPGSPTSAAVWQDKLLLALSGNPGAAFVGFELFARPVLESMQGVRQPYPEACTAFLEVDYEKGSAYPRYVRGTTRIDDGRLYVKPAGADKSSIMVSIKDADCLIYLPAGGSGFRKDEKVNIYML
ncbi:gephyrin-like molybdotransferase Glp [Paenibacillus sp. GP183]|uniref:molybdopterin molybdotransferase MoeA n=1 Tax=Paenibacillus sp. GP183 TaxID=1882751 RepID=UPI00089A48C9|nr:gephyrin-like molybdotransferase Glp [Paenibacillus sp. GP183]SEC63559.1 molybdopterin molybdochelatase [Paenibacillus sp. GP183]